MPATLFGLPAVEVEQPGTAELVPYLVKAVPALPSQWRSWAVTKADGTSYTVSESPAGTWSCSCPAHRWDRHGAGRWQRVGRQAACKHCEAVHRELASEVGDGPDGRPHDPRPAQGVADPP